MHVEDFAREAQSAGAAVLLALGGQPSAYGPLQRLLGELGVPCTGSGHMAVETCADLRLLREQVRGRAVLGPSVRSCTLPRAAVQLSWVVHACAPLPLQLLHEDSNGISTAPVIPISLPELAAQASRPAGTSGGGCRRPTLLSSMAAMPC